MQSYDTNRRSFRRRAGLNGAIPPLTTSNLILAGIGALLGLVLGMIFAWVVWPVQWTNAWPADLSQEARAQYLAAVAESYVYYGDAQAAEVARNRLFDLNDDLPTAIADAQSFFIDNPQANSRVYVSNLGQLAQALNIQSPDIIIEAPVDAAPAVAPNPAAEASVGEGVRAWVNWALTLLAAIVLVGGGFYVVGRLNQRRLATNEADTLDDEADGFDDEPGGVGYIRPTPASNNPYMRPTQGGMGGLSVSSTPTTQRSAPSSQGEDYGFDDDDNDDDLYASGASGRALDYRSEDAIFDDPADDSFDEPLADTLDEAVDEPETIYAPRRSPEVFDNAEDDDDDFEEGESLSSEVASGEVPAAAAAQQSANRGQAQVRTLNTYTFQYHAGIPDYDQSRPIVDPTTGLQVGDCGMGVNMKNNILQNNPDNVIALDVWLVDKKQEKSFSSQDRVLLSEYVVDHSLEQTFTRERPNDPSPIIPQPGTTFQIKGPSLTLDCVVTEATYIKNGPAVGMFQSLSVDMTVRSRT
jgi:hypothetical protein